MLMPESNLPLSDFYHIVCFRKETHTDVMHSEYFYHTYCGLFFHKKDHFFVKFLLKDHRFTQLTLVFYYSHEHDLFTLKEASDAMQKELRIEASHIKFKRQRFFHRFFLDRKLKKNPVPDEELRRHLLRGMI